MFSGKRPCLVDVVYRLDLFDRQHSSYLPDLKWLSSCDVTNFYNAAEFQTRDETHSVRRNPTSCGVGGGEEDT